jgi:hypothetical protein
VGSFGILNHQNGAAADLDTRTLARGVDSPSHTVLVVDDDASIRLLCRVNLQLVRGLASRTGGKAG